MKSLSVSKPLILIMVGLPGSGKSFFARQFSDTFNAPVVSYDRIRYCLTEVPTYEKGENDLVKMLADYQIEELLKTQKTFILDGGSDQRAERAAFRTKVAKAGYDTLLIWVQTDEVTAKYRSMKRSKRRTYDQLNPSLTAGQYDQLASKFLAPADNENHVVISGKHTYATQARVVLKKLVAPREEAAKRPAITGHSGRSPVAKRDDTSTDHNGRRNVLIR